MEEEELEDDGRDGGGARRITPRCSSGDEEWIRRLRREGEGGRESERRTSTQVLKRVHIVM